MSDTPTVHWVCCTPEGANQITVAQSSLVHVTGLLRTHPEPLSMLTRAPLGFCSAPEPSKAAPSAAPSGAPAAAAAPGAAPPLESVDYTDIPNSQIRKVGPCWSHLVRSFFWRLCSHGLTKLHDRVVRSTSCKSSRKLCNLSCALLYRVFNNVGWFTRFDLPLWLQITASRLLQSKQTIPHYYLSSEVRVDKLLE